ncbi:uncharacterized protein LOC143021634 isoform X3 [Oratosquilla oratoria]|uniref:uncharacterized protein LOC143021634 isoform X3 n=1 Tax=Oratosquilla oratoria TaxID=337810 RepID=UPI003F758F21
MAGPRTITSATAPPSIKQQKGQRPQEALPCATQQVTPTRPNKRRHTPFGSPSMARSETGSPRAKQQARMSPVATSPITISTVSCSATKPQQQTATSTTPSSSSSSSPRPSSRSRSVSVSHEQKWRLLQERMPLPPNKLLCCFLDIRSTKKALPLGARS